MHAKGYFVRSDINNCHICQLKNANNSFLPLRTGSVLDDDDIDPDSNFFNSLNTTVSKYFIEDQLLCEVNKNCLSCNIKHLHANICSFILNSEEFKIYLHNTIVEFQLLCWTKTWSKSYDNDDVPVCFKV